LEVDGIMVSESPQRVCSQVRGRVTESFWRLPDGTMRMIATVGGTKESIEASEREAVACIINHELCLLCLQPIERDNVDICTQCVKRETIIEDLLRSAPWRARIAEMLDAATRNRIR